MCRKEDLRGPEHSLRSLGIHGADKSNQPRLRCLSFLDPAPQHWKRECDFDFLHVTISPKEVIIRRSPPGQGYIFSLTHPSPRTLRTTTKNVEQQRSKQASQRPGAHPDLQLHEVRAQPARTKDWRTRDRGR